MVDIPTPAANNKTARNNKEHKLDRTQLGALYPAPKTYEERAQDQNAREARRLKRIPRYLTLLTATRLFAIVSIAAFFYTIAPKLVAWNVISGAFNLVLCALTLLALIKWQAGEISSAFDRKGLNDNTFFTLYGIFVAGIAATLLYQANTQPNGVVILLMYAAIFILHYACVGFIIWLMARAQKINRI